MAPSSAFNSNDIQFMRRALELASLGKGHVEPNPMVGCVITKQDSIVGEGYHQTFGGPHAEVNALQDAGADAHGATAYVTLEPCCHQGKTPPCTTALIQSGIKRVVVATVDPFAAVSGNGIKTLRESGISVEVSLLESDALRVLAPYLKRIRSETPYMIAKWAMTLDGKIATESGDSKWISNEACRLIVHRIRGEVDAIMVGIETALVDDPMLNARPAGPRTATRVVLDSRARLPLDSRLVQTAREIPLIVAVGPESKEVDRTALKNAGAEIVLLKENGANKRLQSLLKELSKREFTNVLVEGGGATLGALLAIREIDEAHLFVGNQIVGGNSIIPFSGTGFETIAAGATLPNPEFKIIENNVYIHGQVAWENANT